MITAQLLLAIGDRSNLIPSSDTAASISLRLGSYGHILQQAA